MNSSSLAWRSCPVRPNGCFLLVHIVGSLNKRVLDRSHMNSYLVCACPVSSRSYKSVAYRNAQDLMRPHPFLILFRLRLLMSRPIESIYGQLILFILSKISATYLVTECWVKASDSWALSLEAIIRSLLPYRDSVDDSWSYCPLMTSESPQWYISIDEPLGFDSRMHNHAAWFFNHYYILIFINYIYWNIFLWVASMGFASGMDIMMVSPALICTSWQLFCQRRRLDRPRWGSERSSERSVASTPDMGIKPLPFSAFEGVRVWTAVRTSEFHQLALHHIVWSLSISPSSV